jgi:hypothetical protein
MTKTMTVLLAAAAALLVTPAEAGDTVGGQIAAFECGDSCYLTIVGEGGTNLTGLCAAEACQSWNLEVAIPQDQIGRPVVVTVGTADQVDAEGNVMGSFVAFIDIAFAD